jgi:hypothetical protein
LSLKVDAVHFFVFSMCDLLDLDWGVVRRAVTPRKFCENLILLKGKGFVEIVE